MIENDQIGMLIVHQSGEFIDFSAARECRSIRSPPPPLQDSHDLHAGTVGEA